MGKVAGLWVGVCYFVLLFEGLGPLCLLDGVNNKKKTINPRLGKKDEFKNQESKGKGIFFFFQM